MLRTVMYRKTPIRIDAPKLNYCEGCLRRKGDVIKKLDTHHWIYEFPTKEVKANPKLVLKNSSVLCFRCHRVADAIRIMLEDQELSNMLLEVCDKACGRGFNVK